MKRFRDFAIGVVCIAAAVAVVFAITCCWTWHKHNVAQEQFLSEHTQYMEAVYPRVAECAYHVLAQHVRVPSESDYAHADEAMLDELREKLGHLNDSSGFARMVEGYDYSDFISEVQSRLYSRMVDRPLAEQGIRLGSDAYAEGFKKILDANSDIQRFFAAHDLLNDVFWTGGGVIYSGLSRSYPWEKFQKDRQEFKKLKVELDGLLAQMN